MIGQTISHYQSMLVRLILVRGFFLPLLCLIASPSLVIAQTEGVERIEVSVSAGWSRLSDQQGFLGTDTDISGGFAFFVTDRIAVGMEVNHTKHTGVLPLQDQNRRSSGQATVVSGNVKYQFGNPSVSGLNPYLVAGVGMLRLKRSDRLVRSVATPCFLCLGGPSFREETLSRNDFRRTEIAFNVGGGIDVKLATLGIDHGIADRLSVRPDFRLFVASSERMIRSSVALVYRW